PQRRHAVDRHHPLQCRPDTRGKPSRGCGFSLTQEQWDFVALENRGASEVFITVRASDGTCLTSSEDRVGISFAEEPMAGGIYYWQSVVLGGVPGQAGGIFSHDFADRGASKQVLKGGCPGCHSLSRDGA